jgi:hypothetical protein
LLGCEELIIRKVFEWINNASPVKETTDLVNKKPIAVLKMPDRTFHDANSGNDRLIPLGRLLIY